MNQARQHFQSNFEPKTRQDTTTPRGGNHDTTEDSISSLILSHKPVRCFRRFPLVVSVVSVVSLSFLLPFDREDQELSKTFYGLKIGPLLRKLQAFKDWSFLGVPHRFRRFPVISSCRFRCFPVVSHDTTGWKPRHHGGQHFQSNFKPQTSPWFPRRFCRFPHHFRHFLPSFPSFPCRSP